MDEWVQDPTQPSVFKTEEARDMDHRGGWLESLVQWLVSPPPRSCLGYRHQAVVPSTPPTILQEKEGSIPTHFTMGSLWNWESEGALCLLEPA